MNSKDQTCVIFKTDWQYVFSIPVTETIQKDLVKKGENIHSSFSK